MDLLVPSELGSENPQNSRHADAYPDHKQSLSLGPPTIDGALRVFPKVF